MKAASRSEGCTRMEGMGKGGKGAGKEGGGKNKGCRKRQRKRVKL